MSNFVSFGQCYHNVIFTLISRWRYDPELILIYGGCSGQDCDHGSVFGPRIAAAHARQDVDGIRRELKQARFISTLVYLPFLLVCLLYGQNILAVFGEAFVGSRDLLVVLAAGQLVNALTGVPGLHLNMIGKSRLELYMAACSVLLGMPLCLIGGFYFGVIGLAVGFSAAIAFKNVGSLLISIRFVSTPTDPKAGNQHLTLKLQTQ